MQYNRYEIILLFFAYSFLGWCGETVAASLIGRRFRNRGFVSTPFCLMYGLMGLAITIAFKDLRSSVVLLFMGATAQAMIVQWATGLFLEHMGRGKWWDYSGLPLNINGYVAVPVSAAFGALGMVAVLFTNDLLVGIFRLFPGSLRTILVWTLLAVAGLDLLVSLLSFLHLGRRSKLKDWNDQLEQASRTLGDRVCGLVIGRIGRAYPQLISWGKESPAETEARQEEQPEVPEAEGENLFVSPEASGDGVPQNRRSPVRGQKKAPGAGTKESDTPSRRMLFWMFLLCALLGDGIETLFMYLTRGVRMSRSSLVWGTFSVVWGLGVAIATWLLYRDRHRSDTYMFLVGTLIGATFEYFCSVFTELVFGAVFWDYSHLPFNIGGRINLLYSFFWGIAAVIWIKHLMPRMETLLRKFFRWERGLVTAFAVVFITLDVLVSGAALIRYNQRLDGKEANNVIAAYIDSIYPDEVIRKKYPGEKMR